MHRFALILLLASVLAVAQSDITPPPPQSAREALIEMITSTAPGTFEKHLMKNTRAALEKLGTAASASGALGMLFRENPAGLETFDTGPVLLRYSDPRTKDRLEVLVDQDDYAGDREEFHFSFEFYAKGSAAPSAMYPETPVVPTIAVTMRQEDDIWKVVDLSVTIDLPVSNQQFLDNVVAQESKRQKAGRESMGQFAVAGMARAEDAYLKTHGTATCNLAELSPASRKAGETGIDAAGYVEMAKRDYKIALSGCVGGNFVVTAEPVSAGAGLRAFCTDQTQTVRYAADGKASTCLQSGKPLGEPSADDPPAVVAPVQ